MLNHIFEAKSLIHKDITLCGYDNRLFMLDFGIVKFRNSSAACACLHQPLKPQTDNLIQLINQ